MANQPDSKHWQELVGDLLTRAAKVCVENGAGADLQAFMNGAYAAFIAASPGLAEQIADAQLRARLEQMRSAGQVASA